MLVRTEIISYFSSVEIECLREATEGRRGCFLSKLHLVIMFLPGETKLERPQGPHTQMP